MPNYSKLVKGLTSVMKAGNETANLDKIPSARQLMKSGQTVSSEMDAVSRFGNGERLFAFHEMSETPLPIRSVDELKNFTYDQLLSLPTTKAKGGAIRMQLGGLPKLAKVFKAPQADALRLAQQRAALPPAKGGLGLPADNMPEQRAKAMGFDTDVYHGSANVANTTRFDPNKVVDNVQYGGKFYSSTSPDYANKYTTNSLLGDSAGVIPMKMQSGKKFEMDKPVSADDAASIMETLGQFNRAKMIRESGRPYRSGAELFYFGLDSSLSNVPKGNAIFRSGFDSIHGDPKLEITGIAGKPHSVVDSADNLRSRFAAFDPFRKDAATAAAMGVAAPDLLAEEKAKGGGIHMQVGGLRLLTNSAKAAQANRALPLRLARAAPKTQAEIDDLATRVARQINNEHVVSGKPNDTKNLAGRSIKENQRLGGLNYVVDPTGAARESVIYQPRKGDVNVAIPGDQTISDSILRSVGDIEGINSHQQGGSKYGLGKMDMEEPVFWASGESAAQNAQNKFNDVGEFFDPERVVGQHMAMGPVSNNFAMHFADANLRAIDWSKAKPNNIDVFDSIIAYGYKDPKTGEKVKFPNWPGLANQEGALAAMKEDSNLRKWFNNRMKTPTLTKPLGLPNGLDIQWAITEPQLRNMEINLTGLSAGEMVPGAGLTDTAAHNTYDKGIRGTALGHQEVLTPFTLSFPDAAQHIASTKNPADFTGTIQKVFPHQIVDDQWLDEIAKYRNLIKKYTGQKEGGGIHMSNFEKRLRGIKDEDGKASIRKIMGLMAGMMGQPTDIASQTFKGRDYKTKKNPSPTTPSMPSFAFKGKQYASGGVTESQPIGFDDGGAAFGVFPHLNRYRSEQDPEAAKNIPVAQARGMAAGLLGLPSDTINLIRAIRNAGRSDRLSTEIPYGSEHWLETLPFKDESPVGKAAGVLGSLTPPVGTALKGATMAGKGAKQFAKTLAEIAGERISMGQPLIPGVPASLTNPPVMNIIKPEGGNWRPDNIERSLRRLKAPVNPDELLKSLDYIKENGVGYASREAALQDENLNRQYQNLLRDKALDQWVDKNLTNYVKKQMGSEKDPVRLLADQGITHYADEDTMRRYLNTSYDQYARNRKVRKHWGMPEEHVANTSMGRAWEEGIDDLMGMNNIKKARDYGNEKFRADNPWIEKLDPNSNLYGIDDQVPNNLQLGHIMDVLKRDLVSGRMSTEDLKNVSMDRAVRRAHEYNLEKAKAMEATALQQQEGFPVHKEYPEGYKWLELSLPQNKVLPKGYSIEKNMGSGLDSDDAYLLKDGTGQVIGFGESEADIMRNISKTNDTEGYKKLQKALDYEGDTMGHCVGSYCDEVAGGNSKIYSLRDKKGEPHVTIKVGTGNNAQAFFDAHSDYLDNPIIRRDLSMMVDPDLDIPLDAQRITAMKNLLDEAGIKYSDVPQALPNIVEIKGKGNRTPKPDYLPYVQDFIRSGNYARDIGDFHNTGLKTLNEAFPEYDSLKYFNRANPDKKYVTQQEIDDWNKEWNTPTEGQKSGGVIKMGVGGLLKNAALIAAREEALAKFPQFRKEIAARQFIEAEYKKAMRNVPYDQQVTLKDWEAKRVLPAAPKTLSAGDMVNGMMVRKDIPNQSSIGASLNDYSMHGVQEVPMSAFETVGKPKYRSVQEEKRTKDLARQIQENKELNPLIVVKDAEGHYILEGGHRFDALRELGIDSFPALMVHDLESLGDIAKPALNKAKGGIALGAGGLLKNALKGIKGTQEILPAVEREANKAKYLKDSKVQAQAYHGPGRFNGVTDIDKFRTIENDTGGAWFASNPDYATQFGDNYVMPVHLNMKNPVDLTKFGNKSLTVNQWKKAMQKAGVDTSEMQIKPAGVLGGANHKGESNYDLWELMWRNDDGQNNIPETLMKQGYDGILAPAEYDSKTPNYVVFEPTQVKSALGNRGTYDITDPDINRAKGGLTLIRK